MSGIISRNRHLTIFHVQQVVNIVDILSSMLNDLLYLMLQESIKGKHFDCNLSKTMYVGYFKNPFTIKLSNCNALLFGFIIHNPKTFFDLVI